MVSLAIIYNSNLPLSYENQNDYKSLSHGLDYVGLTKKENGSITQNRVITSFYDINPADVVTA
jgi:hypothetical protein